MTDPTRRGDALRAPVTSPLDGLLAGLRLALFPAAAGTEADVAALSRVVEWHKVAALAQRHHVASLLLRGLRTRPHLLAATGIEPTLRVRHDRAMRRGLRHLGALKRARDHLGASDVPYLVLKGLPLSQQLYGHPMARDALDIDLLVAPETYRAAARILQDHGWRRIEASFTETPVRTRWYVNYVADLVLAGPGGRLELHQRIFHNPHYFDAPFERLSMNSITIEIGGVPFRTLGEPDSFLYLACHALGHYWRRLIWLCDLAVILASMHPDQFERVAVRFQEAKLESILVSTLQLCRQAFHVEIPKDSVLPSAGRRRAALIARFSRGTWDTKHSVYSRGGFEWTWRKVIWSIVKPSPKLVLHEISSVLVGPRDWARIALPDKLFFLYFLLRPLLWLTRNPESRERGNATPPRRIPQQ